MKLYKFIMISIGILTIVLAASLYYISAQESKDPPINPALQNAVRNISNIDLENLLKPVILSEEEQATVYNEHSTAVFGIYNDEKDFPLGSGFIISDCGIAFTAAHVIDNAIGDAQKLYADFANETRVEITGAYIFCEKSDTAIIQLQSRSEPYPYLEIESYENVNLGDIIYVIGAPQTYYGYFSYGQIYEMRYRTYMTTRYENYVLQLTARMRPGNSGGPIVNENGKVVGFASVATTDDNYEYGITNIAVNITVIDINAIYKMEPKRLYTVWKDNLMDRQVKPPILYDN